MNTQARWLVNINGFRLSETVIVSWIIIAGFAIASYLQQRNLKKVPESKVQVFLEYAVLKLYNLVETTMERIGKKNTKYSSLYREFIFLFFLMFEPSSVNRSE